MGVTTDGTDEEIALKGIEAMVDFYHSIGMPASFHELGIDPTDAQIDEMARRCLEACGSALGSAARHRVFCLLCAGHFVVFCVLHLTFLAKKWKRDGKNKSICLNSKYKRSAPLLHTEAEGVRFSMSAESFQQHKTSFSYHKFSSPFWDELSAKQTERAIHPYKE